MRGYEIPPGTRDLSGETIDERGRLRILPAAYWAGTTPHERGLLCVRHALYCLPTVELIDRLRELIGDRKAIEIGAGNGIIAEALGIPATDSFQQTIPKYRKVYENLGQPIIDYGENVIRLDAYIAVRIHRPEVVIASWVTHRWDPRTPWLEGNEVGVDEEDVLANCQEYILVGNQQVHRNKKIWGREHAIEHSPYLYSRAMNGTPDFIARWKGAAT